MNAKEYNTVYQPKIQHAKCFIRNIPHAAEKSGARDEVMHQLRCIGWSDELVKTLVDALNCYQDHLINMVKEEARNE